MRSQARHLKRLIQLFGAKVVAREANVSTSTIYRWKKRIPKSRQGLVQYLWQDRGNIATDAHIDAASEYSQIRWLVEKGTLPKRFLPPARRRLRLAQKTLKLTCRQSVLCRTLTKVDDLSTDLAMRLAEEHGLSVRQVFTFFHYL